MSARKSLQDSHLPLVPLVLTNDLEKSEGIIMWNTHGT